MQNPRSETSHAKYLAFKEQNHNDPVRLTLFNFKEETVVREFTHWVIIKNRFPYDTMARVNDILVSRRPIGRHYDGTREEEDEYHAILKILAEEAYYDALIENFPRAKSIKSFAHTHLVLWHSTTKKS